MNSSEHKSGGGDGGKSESAHLHMSHQGDSENLDGIGKKAIDPVCGMTVNVKSDSLNLEHEGVVHYFCSSKCLGKFESDPLRYLRPEPSHSEEIQSGHVPCIQKLSETSLDRVPYAVWRSNRSLRAFRTLPIPS